jgi:hypothetical protein
LDILVIGDADHSRATCVHWMGAWPNVGEFDLVIVAQNTLTQEIFDQIPDKLKEIHPQIFAVFKTGRSVWCIMEKLLLPSPTKTGPKTFHGIPPTSYDWLFAYPTINEVREGTSVQTVEEDFAPYLEKVRKWNLEIENIYTHDVQYNMMRPVEPEGIALKPIAYNKSMKMIAGCIVGVDSTLYERSGSICFLPKPSECSTHEAIEILIDIATGEERLEPEWRPKLQIPGVDAVEKQINQLKLDYKKQMDNLEVKWRSLDIYRDMFSVHEAPQIDAVRLALKEIGFETQKTKPGFPVDLTGKDLAVEVTSTAGKVNSDSPKMFQLMQFFEKHRKNEKVVLIANTFKREFPSNRSGKQDFTPHVIGYLQSNEVCAMTCVTLFELWKLAKKDQTKAQKYILQTNGELRL